MHATGLAQFVEVGPSALALRDPFLGELAGLDLLSIFFISALVLALSLAVRGDIAVLAVSLIQ